MAVEARVAAERRVEEQQREAQAEQSRRAQRAAEDRAAELDARRDAILLRARLDHEVAERLDRERVGLQHERRMHELRVAGQRGRPVRLWIAVAAVLCVALAAGYVRVLEPLLARARDRVAVAQRLADARGADNAALSDRIHRLETERSRASRVSEEAKVEIVAVEEPPTARPRPRGRRHARTGRVAPRAAGSELDDLDLSSTDPLTGIADLRR